jgi:hypothetical protein
MSEKLEPSMLQSNLRTWALKEKKKKKKASTCLAEQSSLENAGLATRCTL